jgi:hypothetical protein
LSLIALRDHVRLLEQRETDMSAEVGGVDLESVHLLAGSIKDRELDRGQRFGMLDFFRGRSWSSLLLRPDPDGKVMEAGRSGFRLTLRSSVIE